MSQANKSVPSYMASTKASQSSAKSNSTVATSINAFPAPPPSLIAQQRAKLNAAAARLKQRAPLSAITNGSNNAPIINLNNSKKRDSLSMSKSTTKIIVAVD